MEALEEKIKKFLSISYGSGDGDGDGYGYGDGDGDGSGDGDGYGYGDGDGDGDGYGYGCGYGCGDGCGSGYGSGYGSGSGSGYGSGSGSGVTEWNGKKVYQIDGVATIIDSVMDNYAKGSILNDDFTLTPCYIAKVDNSFAHGETLRQAHSDAQAKALENMPLEKRIEKFSKEFPDKDEKIPARKLYEWHHILTGSCQMGRDHFAREHGINVDQDSFTIREFIKLTANAYGGDAIRKMAKAYGIITD